jgi:hypothetical protein
MLISRKTGIGILMVVMILLLFYILSDKKCFKNILSKEKFSDNGPYEEDILRARRYERERDLLPVENEIYRFVLEDGDTSTKITNKLLDRLSQRERISNSRKNIELNINNDDNVVIYKMLNLFNRERYGEESSPYFKKGYIKFQFLVANINGINVGNFNQVNIGDINLVGDDTNKKLTINIENSPSPDISDSSGNRNLLQRMFLALNNQPIVFENVEKVKNLEIEYYRYRLKITVNDESKFITTPDFFDFEEYSEIIIPASLKNESQKIFFRIFDIIQPENSLGDCERKMILDLGVQNNGRGVYSAYLRGLNGINIPLAYEGDLIPNHSDRNAHFMELRENVKVKFGDNMRNIRDILKLRLSDETILGINQLNERNRNKLFQEFTICAFIKAIDDPNDKNMHMYTLTYDSRNLRFAIDDAELEILSAQNFRNLELKLIEMGGRLLGGYDAINSNELETQLKRSITGRLDAGWEEEICPDCAPAGENRLYYVSFSVNITPPLNLRQINNIKHDLKVHFNSLFGDTSNNLPIGINQYYIHYHEENKFRLFLHPELHHYQSRAHLRYREVITFVNRIKNVIEDNSNVTREVGDPFTIDSIGHGSLLQSGDAYPDNINYNEEYQWQSIYYCIEFTIQNNIGRYSDYLINELKMKFLNYISTSSPSPSDSDLRTNLYETLDIQIDKQNGRGNSKIKLFLEEEDEEIAEDIYNFLNENEIIFTFSPGDISGYETLTFSSIKKITKTTNQLAPSSDSTDFEEINSLDEPNNWQNVEDAQSFVDNLKRMRIVVNTERVQNLITIGNSNDNDRNSPLNKSRIKKALFNKLYSVTFNDQDLNKDSIDNYKNNKDRYINYNDIFDIEIGRIENNQMNIDIFYDPDKINTDMETYIKNNLKNFDNYDKSVIALNLVDTAVIEVVDAGNSYNRRGEIIRKPNLMKFVKITVDTDLNINMAASNFEELIKNKKTSIIDNLRIYNRNLDKLIMDIKLLPSENKIELYCFREFDKRYVKREFIRRSISIEGVVLTNSNFSYVSEEDLPRNFVLVFETTLDENVSIKREYLKLIRLKLSQLDTYQDQETIDTITYYDNKLKIYFKSNVTDYMKVSKFKEIILVLNKINYDANNFQEQGPSCTDGKNGLDISSTPTTTSRLLSNLNNSIYHTNTPSNQINKYVEIKFEEHIYGPSEVYNQPAETYTSGSNYESSNSREPRDIDDEETLNEILNTLNSSLSSHITNGLIRRKTGTSIFEVYLNYNSGLNYDNLRQIMQNSFPHNSGIDYRILAVNEESSTLADTSNVETIVGIDNGNYITTCSNFYDYKIGHNNSHNPFTRREKPYTEQTEGFHGGITRNALTDSKQIELSFNVLFDSFIKLIGARRNRSNSQTGNVALVNKEDTFNIKCEHIMEKNQCNDYNSIPGDINSKVCEWDDTQNKCNKKPCNNLNNENTCFRGEDCIFINDVCYDKTCKNNTSEDKCKGDYGCRWDSNEEECKEISCSDYNRAGESTCNQSKGKQGRQCEFVDSSCVEKSCEMNLPPITSDDYPENIINECEGSLGAFGKRCEYNLLSDRCESYDPDNTVILQNLRADIFSFSFYNMAFNQEALREKFYSTDYYLDYQDKVTLNIKNLTTREHINDIHYKIRIPTADENTDKYYILPKGNINAENNIEFDLGQIRDINIKNLIKRFIIEDKFDLKGGTNKYVQKIRKIDLSKEDFSQLQSRQVFRPPTDEEKTIYGAQNILVFQRAGNDNNPPVAINFNPSFPNLYLNQFCSICYLDENYFEHNLSSDGEFKITKTDTYFNSPVPSGSDVSKCPYSPMECKININNEGNIEISATIDPTYLPMKYEKSCGKGDRNFIIETFENQPSFSSGRTIGGTLGNSIENNNNVPRPDANPSPSPVYPEPNPSASPVYLEPNPSPSPNYLDANTSPSPDYPDANPSPSPDYPDNNPLSSSNNSNNTISQEEVDRIINNQSLTLSQQITSIRNAIQRVRTMISNFESQNINTDVARNLLSQLESALSSALNTQNNLNNMDLEQISEEAQERQNMLSTLSGIINNLINQVRSSNTSQEQRESNIQTVNNISLDLGNLGENLNEQIGTLFQAQTSLLEQQRLILESSAKQSSQSKQTTDSKQTQEPKQISDEYRNINDSLIRILDRISEGGINRQNQDEVNKKLKLLESMINIIERREGNNENTVFLKKLLLISQMQMNNLAKKISEINNNKNYDTPHLPSISQYKPEGPSNIFSPLIDIKTSSEKDNRRFANAYERGFDRGLQQAQDYAMFSDTFNDFNAQDQVINQDRYVMNNYYQQQNLQNQPNQPNQQKQPNQPNQQKQPKQPNQQNQPKQTNQPNQPNNLPKQNNNQGNGYLRGENDRLGIPGYSFLHPNHFDVPVQRHPVCLDERQTQNRGNASLHPAGYLSSGHSNVMEFHSVGSILPKFEYSEETEYRENTNNRI